jgi:hypothetical protein
VEVVLAADAAQAALVAVERARPGDAVLVKASRSVGAERVVAALADRFGPRSGMSVSPPRERGGGGDVPSGKGGAR